jgi:hypothetical protein
VQRTMVALGIHGRSTMDHVDMGRHNPNRLWNHMHQRWQVLTSDDDKCYYTSESNHRCFATGTWTRTKALDGILQR